MFLFFLLIVNLASCTRQATVGDVCKALNTREVRDCAELSLEESTRTSVNKWDDDRAFIIRLANGTVVDGGGILTYSGYILGDTRSKYIGDHHDLQKREAENIEKFSGTIVALGSPGANNWYHWLLQVLPRLIILSESKLPYDKIFIDNLKYKWQKDSLDIVLKHLNIDKNKIFTREGMCGINATTLLVPSVPILRDKTPWDYWPSWIVDELKGIFLNDCQAKGDLKIYISRSKATCRRIENEDDIFNMLSRKGFKKIYLEDLDPREQASMFASSSIIVGPHGSAFANLIFSKPGFKLVEIDNKLSGDQQRSWFKRLTQIMEGRYFPFYPQLVAEEDIEKDIKVDVEAFEIYIDSIL